MHTIETLKEALMIARLGDSSIEARTFPSSFDPLRVEPAFFRALSWHWQSAEYAIRRIQAKGVMMRLPLFLQYEAPLARAAHEAGAYIFINDADNMPLGAAALIQAEIGCIVTTGIDGEAFGEYLKKKNISAPGWLLVRHFEEASWELPHSIAETRSPVTQEIHLFPGLPMFVQCDQLAADRLPRFHVADDLSCHEAEDSISIDSPHTEPFPFVGLSIRRLRKDGICPCGKSVFVRE